MGDLYALLPDDEAVDRIPDDELPVFLERLLKLQAQVIGRAFTARLISPHDHLGSDEMLTAVEVAAQLNTSKAWVYRHKDKLGGLKLGRTIRFPRKALEAYIADQGEGL